MNKFAYYVLHYGKDWLFHSLKSVRQYVDEIYVFYADRPTFGYTTSISCPESKQELHEIAKMFDVRWIQVGRFPYEGLERDYAVNLCKLNGAEIVIVTDADEIWDQNYLPYAIDYVRSMNTARSWRCNFRHLWKTVNWICDDPAMPVRIIDLRHNEGEGYVHKRFDTDVVYHFGYAQNHETIKYKMEIHGHKNELRPNWYEEKFVNWKPGMNDVHPTNVDFWNPQLFDTNVIKHLIS